MSMVKPVLILGALTGVALYAVTSSAKTASPPPPSAPPSFILDANIPPALRGQVLSALATVTHVGTLESFANTIAPAFPIAAAQLRVKAQTLRAALGGVAPPAGAIATPSEASPPAPAVPQAEPARPPIQVVPQGELQEPLRSQVTEQITIGTDANMLETLARAIEATHPVLAAMLRGRAALVRTVESAAAAVSKASAPSPPPAPATPYVPAPYIPASPQGAVPAVPASLPAQPAYTPPPAQPYEALPAPPPASPALPGGAMWGAGIVPGLDAGMPADVTERVLRALSPSESNPDTLRALGNELASRFPIASALVLAKANSLALLTLSTPAAASAAPPAPPPAPSPPPMRPTSLAVPTPPARPTDGPTYVVQQNDFPIKIAKKHNQPERAWLQLVAANPHKEKRADGNFKSLQPGETINIPPAWLAGRASSQPSVEPLRGAAPALDPNLPGDVASAVMNALGTSTDAADLRGFASSIMQQYPIASAVLMAKAAALQAGGIPQAIPAVLRPAGAPPAAQPTRAAAPASAQPPRAQTPAPQTQEGGTYTVIAGDSPIRIAKKFGQPERAWPQLVAANPHKEKRADGNFKSLQPNEKLKIPAAWAVPATRVAGEDESPSWATGGEDENASWATGAEGDDAPPWATGAEGEWATDKCGPMNVAGEDDYAPGT